MIPVSSARPAVREGGCGVLSADGTTALRYQAIVVLLAGLTVHWPAAVSAAPAFTGAFMGSGHTCYGGLYVRTKTLSWLTPYSPCRAMPYRTLEHSEQGHARRFVFQFKRHGKGCRFNVLVLQHADTADPAIAWDATGYASLSDYRSDRQSGFKTLPATAMACSLYATE